MNKLTDRTCPVCEKDFNVNNLSHFTWRFTDKSRTYIGSGRKIIHTGGTYLCEDCLEDVVKVLNGNTYERST